MLVLLIFIGLLILYKSRIDFRKLSLAFKIPGPWPLPFVGNGLKFVNKTSPEILQIVINLVRNYGDVVGVWIKSDFHVLISDPKSVEIILSSKQYIEKSSIYEYIKPWLSEGLLLSSGSKWTQRRKLLTPAFHFKILEQFVEIFDNQSIIFIQNISQYNQSDKVELFPLVTLYALDVICESAMGVQIDAQRTANSAYVLAVKNLSHIIHLRMAKFIYREDLLFRFSSFYNEHKNALQIVHDFTNKVVRERKMKILTEVDDIKKDFDESLGQKRKMNFLDILIKSTIDGSSLSDSDIQEEVDTFMFEGHDTTASGITFCLYSIAKNREVQHKCFQEIRDVIGDDRRRAVSLHSLNNLNYLDLVIKETLRLFPSVPIFGRQLQEETKLGNYTLPKGTEVVFPIYGMGHDPKLFADPEKFQPERFLGEHTAEEANPFAYIPFSAGPRNCIGQKFAVLELKSVISKVLRYFEISLAEDSLQYPVLTAELILFSESKINFYIKPRVY